MNPTQAEVDYEVVLCRGFAAQPTTKGGWDHSDVIVALADRVAELERERAKVARLLQGMVGPAGYLAQPALAAMVSLLNDWPAKARLLVARLTSGKAIP